MSVTDVPEVPGQKRRFPARVLFSPLVPFPGTALALIIRPGHARLTSVTRFLICFRKCINMSR